MTRTVGFVGLGTMGAPMASNIIRDGVHVRLLDANPEVARALSAQVGGTAVTDLEGLIGCEAIIFMLPTSAIVRSALFTDDGQLRAPLTTETLLIDMSSSDPTETLETGRMLRAHGLTLVDAPVSGARERAETGTLSIMLGAPDDTTAERAEVFLAPMSAQIYRTGALGTGHAMKALNNFVAAASYTAASEALIAGQRFGLNASTMVQIFNASTGQSFVTEHVLEPHIVQERFATGFALGLMTKDVRIAASLQSAVDHHAPVCEAVSTSLGRALESLGNVDHTRAYTFWDGE
ncbi:NAD(P)-dependent oxidoreductase [Citricoccus muralis]|uniref:NAD(P)-dependent oxidoreductase n=1 Tax=Citricoccus muralis TaxID=169134 RepID=A0ABY8H844_9MICC|nr:NAD(P)-dependent oxidoreductase [Citricoccus muralis]WFP16787.1 NAD(P)-dependent oxidoreductase [Citricoccus muralis]